MRALLVFVLALVFASPAWADPPARAEFPAASPESVGLQPAALKALDDAVQGYIDQDQAVGAELLIIKNRKTVWHTAHGLGDNVTKAPMQTGGIFCIRSMTKPFVGTAIQMLIDEGKISPKDPAFKYLPAFDSDSHRAITIENLLEHRSGLHLSSLIATDHKSLKSVQDVADLASNAPVMFTPGTAFNYSDDGTDTLTAIIEKVTGGRVENFIQQRILDPLGMRDTIPVIHKDDARLARVNSNHGGGPGAWTRYWSPADDPLFPYFLGSQAMYSTCEDYARLLCLWADGGVAGGRRLLSAEAIKRGLTPYSEMGYPSAGPDITVRYGQLWMVCTTGQDADQKLVFFGHGGSDGTTAWMWPDRDLIVMYFTQSRGGTTVVSIDQAIDKYLIRADLASAGLRGDLAAYEGVFWNPKRERFWAVWPADGKLRLELEALAIADLVPGDAPDDWKFELNPTQRVRFERDASGALNAAVIWAEGAGEIRAERLAADASLPAADEVVKKVRAAHGVGSIHGIIRRSGTLDMPAAKVNGPWVNYLTADRARTDIQVRGSNTRILVADGKVKIQRGAAPVEEMSGALAQQTLGGQANATFGDWSALAGNIRVIQRIQRDSGPALVVRLIPAAGNPSAFIVDEQTGRVLESHRVEVSPGLGLVGAISRFEQFEEVGGATLPRLIKTEYGSPLLGNVEVRIDRTEVLDVPPDEVFSMTAK